MEHTTHHPEHKSPNYVFIFVWLIVITAAEVAVGYIPNTVLPTAIQYPLLLSMAGAKILLVALYYMHLRYDSRWFLLAMIVSLPLSVMFILALVLGYVRK
jgi:caa(3)-type oxidase subunit IV